MNAILIKAFPVEVSQIDAIKAFMNSLNINFEVTTDWNENINIPLEQQRLVLDRIQNSRKNPSLMLDWDEVSKEL